MTAVRDSATVVEDRVYFVYLLASKPNGTLYLGVTSNIIGRTWQHKEGVFEGFTRGMAFTDSSGTRPSTTFILPFSVRKR